MPVPTISFIAYARLENFAYAILKELGVKEDVLIEIDFTDEASLMKILHDVKRHVESKATTPLILS